MDKVYARGNDDFNMQVPPMDRGEAIRPLKNKYSSYD